jgi:hypothetical protein
MEGTRDVLIAASAAAAGVLVGLWIAQRSNGLVSSKVLLPKTEELASAAMIERLMELTRAAAGEGPAAAPELPNFVASNQPLRRPLTQEEKDAFNRDGFVLCKGFFTLDEVEVLKKAVVSDKTVEDQKISVKDTEGKDTKLTLWWKFGEDTCSLFGRSASLVQACADLMGGCEPYLSHTKVLLKEPRSGGAWEWHQDFGYWYSQGLLHPDKIINAIIPMDTNTLENGCMRLLRKSHTLGRIEHGTFGGQAGADPRRVLAAMRLGGYDVVPLALEPGDVAFMHSNTLHASAPNLSDKWRRNIIVAYNSIENGPLGGSPAGQPQYNKIKVVDESTITATGAKGLSAENDFLGQ